ncbi:UNVERIFIED_CONTAM: hypothetical protein Slati_3912000, partial [Sesamum latifolium]
RSESTKAGCGSGGGSCSDIQGKSSLIRSPLLVHVVLRSLRAFCGTWKPISRLGCLKPRSSNRDKIETWDVLKKELKDQFLPCNTSWLARESLRKLKHTGTVRDCMKKFSSLMLDVRDMSEEDKLFNFLSGLQTWAQTVLRCQGVKDMPSAIAAADRLVDYWVISGSNPEKKKKDSGKEKGKSNKVGKDGKFKRRKIRR